MIGLDLLYSTARKDVSHPTRSSVCSEWWHIFLKSSSPGGYDAYKVQQLCLLPFCTAVYSTSFELPLNMSIFTCRAVFSVFSLFSCLIDSNMGFLNGLSSDLFPHELMTQNNFKDARWECRSLWSATTGFVLIYPTDPNQILQRQLSVRESEHRCRKFHFSCVSLFCTLYKIRMARVLR